MKRLNRRQRQQVYRRAAAIILNGENFYSCVAIEHANHIIYHVGLGSELSTHLLNEYAEFFKPVGKSASSPWWGICDPTSQKERALALLFMAEIT